MQLTSLGPLPISIIVSLAVAVVLLGVRISVMQRMQRSRQRENRQETERLKSMVAAYRLLAGSFTPTAAGGTGEPRALIEEALSELVLFGTVPQVELAAAAARALAEGREPELQPLVELLRADLRTQLGLDSIPSRVLLPPSGPGRARPARGEGGGAGGRGGGGGGGGGGMGGAGAGGVAGGLIAADGLQSLDR